MRLTRLTIENFKSLRVSSLEGLTTLNAVIGPNNEGKSSILEAIRLAQGVYDETPRLREWFPERLPDKDSSAIFGASLTFVTEPLDTANIPALKSQNPETIRLVLGWGGQNEANRQPNRLYLKEVFKGSGRNQVQILSPDGTSGRVRLADPSSSKTLTLPRSDERSLIQDLTHNDVAQVLNQNPPLGLSSPNGWFGFLAKWAREIIYVSIDRTIPPIGSLKEEGKVTAVGLPALITKLNTNHAPRFRDFVQVVSELVPSVQQVYAHQEGEGNVSIRVSPNHSLEDSAQAFRLDTVGSGVVEVLYLVASIWLSDPGSVLFIEEPERGLHPGAQRSLLRRAIEHAKQNNKQIFWSTHSTTMAPISEDSSVHVVSRGHSGWTTATPISAANMDHIAKVLGQSNLDFFGSDTIVLMDGETEERVILPIARSILDSLRLAEIRFDRLGGDLKSQSALAASIARVAKNGRTKIVLLMDDDNGAKKCFATFNSKGLIPKSNGHFWECGVSDATHGRGPEFEDNFSDEELVTAANTLAGGTKLTTVAFKRLLTRHRPQKVSKVLSHYFFNQYGYGLSKPELGDCLAEIAIPKIKNDEPRGRLGTKYEIEDALRRLLGANPPTHPK